jgi:hypothetical protein
MLQAAYNLVTVFVIPLPYLLLPPTWYSAQIASLSRTLNSPITGPLKGVQSITVLQSNTWHLNRTSWCNFGQFFSVKILSHRTIILVH